MKEFLNIVLGTATVPQFFAALFFAFLTALAMLLVRATKRDIVSTRTPFKWSWRFLFSDNMARIVSTAIFIFLCIRFGQRWFAAENLAYLGLLIGVIADRLSWLFSLISTALQGLIKNWVKNAGKG